MCQSLTNTCKSAKGEKYCKKQLSQASAEPCSAAKLQNSAHSQLASTNKMPAASAISPFLVQNTINTKQPGKVGKIDRRPGIDGKDQDHDAVREIAEEHEGERKQKRRKARRAAVAPCGDTAGYPAARKGSPVKQGAKEQRVDHHRGIRRHKPGIHRTAVAPYGGRQKGRKGGVGGEQDLDPEIFLQAV